MRINTIVRMIIIKKIPKINTLHKILKQIYLSLNLLGKVNERIKNKGSM